MIEEQQRNEEDQDEDYWRSYNEQLYWSRFLSLAIRIEFLKPPRMTWSDATMALSTQKVAYLNS